MAHAAALRRTAGCILQTQTSATAVALLSIQVIPRGWVQDLHCRYCFPRGVAVYQPTCWLMSKSIVRSINLTMNAVSPRSAASWKVLGGPSSIKSYTLKRSDILDVSAGRPTQQGDPHSSKGAAVAPTDKTQGTCYICSALLVSPRPAVGSCKVHQQHMIARSTTYCTDKTSCTYLGCMKKGCQLLKGPKGHLGEFSSAAEQRPVCSRYDTLPLVANSAAERLCEVLACYISIYAAY